MENPYEWETEDLLTAFMRACARIGGGGIFNVGRSVHLSQAHYLCAVVQARIDRAKPPFNPGEHVRPKRDMVKPITKLGSGFFPERKLPKSLAVGQVFYLGEHRWEITFIGENKATAQKIEDHDGDHPVSWWEPLQFKTEDFEPIKT